MAVGKHQSLPDGCQSSVPVSFLEYLPPPPVGWPRKGWTARLGFYLTACPGSWCRKAFQHICGTPRTQDTPWDTPRTQETQASLQQDQDCTISYVHNSPMKNSSKLWLLTVGIHTNTLTPSSKKIYRQFTLCCELCCQCFVWFTCICFLCICNESS